jgi:hypothetical protein
MAKGFAMPLGLHNAARKPARAGEDQTRDIRSSKNPQSGETGDGEHWRWCPRCGHELHNEKCKFRCPRCHYFMSCSDFD